MDAIKYRAKRYAKALMAALGSGGAAAVAVGTAGPGSGSAETYVSGVIVALLIGTAVALVPNAAKRAGS